MIALNLVLNLVVFEWLYIDLLLARVVCYIIFACCALSFFIEYLYTIHVDSFKFVLYS